jgi:hypothetical protein
LGGGIKPAFLSKISKGENMAGLSRASQGIPTGGSLTPFWKPAETGSRAFVLNPNMDTLFVCTHAQTFTGNKSNSGPINASWTIIDDDVYTQLGPKVQTQGKVFVWVAVDEGGEYVPKLYQMSAKLFEGSINLQVNEMGKDLQGMMLYVRKDNGRWNVAASDPSKAFARVAPLIQPLWDEIVAKGLDGSTVNAEVNKMTSTYPSVQEEKEFLMKRCNVNTWNEVLQKFGQAPQEDGGANTEVDEFD